MRRARVVLGLGLGALMAVMLVGPAAADPVPRPTPSTSVRAPETLAGLYSTTSMELILLERSKGPRAALAELERRIASDPRLAGLCHAVAHDLGHEAMDEVHGDAPAALAARNDVCGGGYTHGIIELALGDSKKPARDLLKVCAPRQDGSCFHGVGHGLMFATGMDVHRSLQLCDRAPTALLSSRCGEGVFMQLFGSDVSGGHSNGVSSPTPKAAAAACRRTRLPYAANCWFYSPTVWLTGRPDDFAGAMSWCTSAGSAFGEQMCARGVGSRTIKYHPDDPRIGAAVCAAAGDLTDSCLAGMGSYWSVHFKGRVPPHDVCSHLGVPRLESRCLTVIRG